MDSTKRLYVSIAALAVVGGLVYRQTKQEKTEEAAHSLAAMEDALPKLSLDEEVTKTIDTVELHIVSEAKEGSEPAPAEDVVLKKKGEEEWALQKPIEYPANAGNVTSLLKNLNGLKLVERVSTLAESYEKWGLTDDKALHAVFKKGEEVILDAYFGENGSRGQMTRLAGQDGVYAIKGFSRYLYAREAKNWRDKTIFKFDDKEVAKVSVSNEHGTFNFEKKESSWAGTFNGKPVERFKPSKVDDLLRAYKTLNASDFGDDKTAAEIGLGEKPAATVKIDLKDGTSYELAVGDTSEGTSRWVKPSSKDGIFSISSWAADWALGELSKYQEKTEEEKAAASASAKPPINPHAMP